MSIFGTGLHGTSNAANFMPLTQPTELPVLTTTDGSKSPYLPLGQITEAPKVPGWSDFPPERQDVDFGQIDYFKFVNNDTDIIERITLAVRLDGLVAAGGGANPCYTDDVLCAAVDRIEFHYGKDVQELFGDEIHFRRVAETEEKELARLAILQGLGLPVATRQVMAQVPQWYYLELPFWFARSQAEAYHQYAFQRLTRVVIHWRTPNFILQQEGVNAQPTTLGGGHYILDHFLRCQVVCPSQATRDYYMSMVKMQKSAGWLHLIGQVQILEQQLLAGATLHTILLNTFTKFGYNIRWVIRPQANLNANFLNNRRFETTDIVWASLQISGKDFFFATDNFYMTYGIANVLFLGNPELGIYNIPLNTSPDLHESATGGLQFSSISNPQLQFLTVPLPENSMVTIMFYTHNYIRMVLEGGASLIEPVLSL